MKIMDERGKNREASKYHVGDTILRPLKDSSGSYAYLSLITGTNITGWSDVLMGEYQNIQGYCSVGLQSGQRGCMCTDLDELYRIEHIEGEKLVKAHVVIDRDDTNG